MSTGVHPAVSCRPLLTSAILIETSLGSFVVDLYGVDCPSATAEVVNLCRCKYFNGCVATEVVPDNIIIFTHPIDALRKQTFASLLGNGDARAQCADGQTAAVARSMRSEWQRMKGHVARLKRRQRSSEVEFVPSPATGATGTINRRGLLLVEVPQHTDGTANGEGRSASCLVLTLSNKYLDYFENRFMVVGEVCEGNVVIEKMRAAPHQRSSSVTGITSRPTRLVRIKHATVLPTAGANSFADVSRGSADAAPAPGLLVAAFGASGCFRYWAPPKAVRAANRAVLRLLKESFAACRTTDVSQNAAFFLPHNPLHSEAKKSTKEEEQEGGDDTDEILSVEYNPHFHGEYLSSGEDDDVPHTKSRSDREQRRQAVLRIHQEKLNETRALMLNLLDGVADVSRELKPPENVLFVCKLNPLTTGEGLAMCFSQFGTVRSAEVVHDRKTGNSLCYGFVEFSDMEACYRAFQKMDKALVDDHRIHVDFSQSVSKLWGERQREMRKRARADA